MAGVILFQDDFPSTGPLDTRWDFNHWEAKNNPSYLGLTQMRQSLPRAENAMARIRLDTWNDGKSFLGSEAITREAFSLPGGGGGIAFECKFKFEGTQGGMIAGFFAYQAFPPGADRDIHDEIDFEILTTNLKKISTNVFAHETLQKTAHPMSFRCRAEHLLRFSYLPDGMVSGPRQLVRSGPAYSNRK